MIRYQAQWYSSGVASGGGLIGTRDSWDGLRSIISWWLCSVSMTVRRETPDGRGVMVVKRVFLDILAERWS